MYRPSSSRDHELRRGSERDPDSRTAPKYESDPRKRSQNWHFQSEKNFSQRKPNPDSFLSQNRSGQPRIDHQQSTRTSGARTSVVAKLNFSSVPWSEDSLERVRPVEDRDRGRSRNNNDKDDYEYPKQKPNLPNELDSVSAIPLPPTPPILRLSRPIPLPLIRQVFESNPNFTNSPIVSTVALHPYTSSPISSHGEGSFVFPPVEISDIVGSSSQVPAADANITMPRIVTLQNENGKDKCQPLDDVDSVSDDADSSDDDIIVLDDDGKEVKVRPKRTHRELNDHTELCSFHGHTLTSHDYKTLAEEEFLNDSIVNFYLSYLFENLSAPLKEAIHISSSHFYSRLKGHSKSNKKPAPGQLTNAEKSYIRVKSWTRKIDIFSKRMLIYPICEESHWYVVIVCNPGMVLSTTRTRNFEEKREEQQKLEPHGANPFVMVLDSLGGTHSSAVSRIRSYLQFEHLERKKLPLNFGKEKMYEKHPPIPQQPNSCDCGVFLLHYVELIFRDPAKFLGAKLPDLSQWFSSKDIDYKREDIANLIKKLSAKQKTEKIIFPHIKFPAKRPKSTTPVPEAEQAEATGRLTDPRLRRHPEAAAGLVRQIRITKTPVQVVSINNLPGADSSILGPDNSSISGAGKSPDLSSLKPTRFSLTLPAKKIDQIQLSADGKRSFEDWNKTVQLKPGPFPPLPPLPPSSSRDKPSYDEAVAKEDRGSSSHSRRSHERGRDRSSREDSSRLRDRDESGRSRDRQQSREESSRLRERPSCDESSRPRHREDDPLLSQRGMSDNDILFGRGPAESAKRRSTEMLSTSKWKVKEETTFDDAEDEPVAKKRRFKLHREVGASRPRRGEIKTTEDMFVELMKGYDKKKKL